MTMVVENKDGKGNPYHDEEGQFTSKEETLALAPLSEQLISHIKEKDLEQKFLETIGLSSLDEAKEILDKMNSKNIKQIAQIFGIELIDQEEIKLSSNFDERLGRAYKTYEYFKTHYSLEDYIDVERVNNIEDKKNTLINVYRLDKWKINQLSEEQIDKVFKSLYLIAFKQNARIIKQFQGELDIKEAQSIIGELMNKKYVYSKYAKNTAVHLDRKYNQLDDAQSLLGTFWKEQKNKMPQHQLWLLKAYTGNGYSWINAPLYGGKFYNDYDPESYKNNPIEFAYVTREMTNALSKCSLPFNMWVSRGQGEDSKIFSLKEDEKKSTLEEAYEKYGDALVGSSFKLENFVSTSAGKNAAFGKDLYLNIYCPKGTNLAYVAPDSQYMGENEVVIQRGYSYKITKIEKRKYGGFYLDVEVVLGSNKDIVNSLEGLAKIKEDNLIKNGYKPSNKTNYTTSTYYNPNYKQNI